MYQINPTTNELIELHAKRFGELGFKEREHLQEWLANCPTALGEERHGIGVSPIYFVFLKPSTLSSLFPYARD